MSLWGEIQRLRHLQKLEPEDMLCELLALIHRDGGQHTDEVGLARSVFDAEKRLAITSVPFPKIDPELLPKEN